MYVCLCNAVTERDIHEAAAAGCSGMPELTMRTGCGACCGSCVPTACEVLEQARSASKTAAADPPVRAAIARAA
ncbi:(2Fe-2S)-binding protein [Luteimonas sp. R10]|uniref:(2Fe-2S)-binding protein n=1 Tax=Luteimonas sp. R10 TaxID=3108176 RepID=UPI003088BE29|nr:(2Fe-2S)-binding protein [Luteimonas sp. R10]